MTLFRFRLLFLTTSTLALMWPIMALETRPASPLIGVKSAPIKSTFQNISGQDPAPILMYHYIRDTEKRTDLLGQKLSTSPKNFDAQLSWLKNHGYETVAPNFLLTPHAIMGKPIILTFDDGYRDAFTGALPLLKKYNMTATFYVIVNSLGKPIYLTWDEIKIMKASGMNIASHTLHHPPLATLSTQKIDWELSESKRELDKRLNQNTIDFAYPYGSYDRRVVESAKKAGYQTAVTVMTGVASEKNNMLELPRLRVSDNTNFEELLKVSPSVIPAKAGIQY
ncbi:MAG: Polysaccharide deacetylase family protein [candidate division CPR1 bacterium GW2011_GWA2_42_17]|uniref:Polysaccharide deacetylase family protein n=1 Tax=candidate division CPR1 bacterium GW2011_GWA2_42_17 TaxID=1618341 RepID=A0A0G0YXL2_9BACT|nr:MAG: Polysaccharide deacetylase family protein [candidate division CPR1 bacterium GW2011_GWA2_42_17]